MKTLQCPNCFEEFEVTENKAETLCPHCHSELRICCECGEVYEDISAAPECPACGHSEDDELIQCPGCFVFIRIGREECVPGMKCPRCGKQILP